MTRVGILVKNQFARSLGIAFAVDNTFAQMVMIQAYPAWSLALWSLDMLVIYALVVDGGRSYRAGLTLQPHPIWTMRQDGRRRDCPHVHH